MNREEIGFEQLRSELKGIVKDASLYIEMFYLDARCYTALRISAETLDLSKDSIICCQPGRQIIKIAPSDFVTRNSDDGSLSYEVNYDTLRVMIWIE